MKVFIFYASAGAGHFKSAQAVYDCLRKKDASLDIRLIDTLDYSSAFFRRNYAYGYTFIIKYFLWLWAFFFWVTSFRLFRPLVNSIHYAINRLNTPRFSEFLIKENPDFILSTHFMPSQIGSCLKAKRRINSRLITIITDFDVHPFWISKYIDTYIVACEFTRDRLVREGIKEERIKVSGIPIQEKFSYKKEKREISKKLDIPADKFTVLIITGSFGIGPIEEIVELLHKEDINLLVVCARNKNLFERMEAKRYPNARVFGFVDNIDELMSVSDIIITKPGGLTLSEILAMEVVPVFIHAIPGQEMGNVRVMAGYGIGSRPADTSQIKGIVSDYRANPQKLNEIKERIRRINKPYAVEELCNALCQGSPGPAC